MSESDPLAGLDERERKLQQTISEIFGSTMVRLPARPGFGPAASAGLMEAVEQSKQPAKRKKGEKPPH